MLLTLSHSPFHTDVPALLRLAGEGDDLLLMQDGVLAGLTGSAALDLLLAAPISLFALKEDVEARGLTGQISDKIALVDYTIFVTLTVKHVQQIAG
ncbi:sulfurtransferase complex subunit TusB [Nissabacter sp. SGAir0207]|uniref:sulfurtransferase complex subunit TusB n=1 Tax=Nissabacter sp. SGAir0207 TaxID=2126321 RepID=UPI0010CD35E0|nr:sulfurtransferase complex subunit TusB [Nissabacter sp. SGAir0207]QCR34805.1 sulfurtransferase complex subunit TusB [Nissabacter sp. SGAir0207]